MEEQNQTPQPLRVLAVVAHPDDMEFGAAGSLARWADEGAEITLCLVTDGSAGSNAPDADLVALAATRQDEQRAAVVTIPVNGKLIEEAKSIAQTASSMSSN